MTLPGTGRGIIRAANGGGGSSLRKREVYAARSMQRTLSLPEALLWKHLSGQKLGFRCRKQHPIGPYVVDFYVASESLVVEIDGEAHDRGDRPERDQRRDSYLRERGYQLLRIPAVEVFMEGVLQAIVAAATNPLHRQAALDGPPPRPGEDL